MTSVHGLHHVTAICGDPQENLDFYRGVLGMRLVKRSVNQDAPDTYHLFYADAEGHPGTDLTFFPWPHMAPGTKGAGLVVEVALAVPDGSLSFWAERLGDHGVATGDPETRFGAPALSFRDPHGLELALVQTAQRREFTAWDDGPVPEEQQIRGLHAVRLLVNDRRRSGMFLRQTLGFEATGEDMGWQRFEVEGGGSGAIVEIAETPEAPAGEWGVGGVHHVAFRVADDDEHVDVRDQVVEAGARPTAVIDRFWFRSVYFREPGGVLFELATDGPGFAIDEDVSSLGETLILPPWLEPRRHEIEAALPALELPKVRV